MKYNPIENRTDKAYLRTFPGNFEIISVIGKQTNRTALMTTKDIINNTMHIRKYERTMQGFRDVLKSVIVANEVDINNPTMNNGGKIIFYERLLIGQSYLTVTPTARESGEHLKTTIGSFKEWFQKAC